MTRTAVCLYCKREVPSSPSLPFFESRVDGTYEALICKCGFAEVAHYWSDDRVRREPVASHEYEPRGGYDTDAFYCGCRGWD